jgi:hypothetical protein
MGFVVDFLDLVTSLFRAQLRHVLDHPGATKAKPFPLAGDARQRSTEILRLDQALSFAQSKPTNGPWCEIGGVDVAPLYPADLYLFPLKFDIGRTKIEDFMRPESGVPRQGSDQMPVAQQVTMIRDGCSIAWLVNRETAWGGLYRQVARMRMIGHNSFFRR